MLRFMLMPVMVAGLAVPAHAQDKPVIPHVPVVPFVVPGAPGVAPPPTNEVDAACKSGFASLRNEAERRGKLVKAAADRKAPREEACEVVSHFSRAERAMVDYVEKNAARCVIPPPDVARLKEGRAKTEMLQRRLCAVPGV